MSNIYFNLSNVKYSIFNYFTKDAEDWFGHGILCCSHASASRLLYITDKKH